MVSELINLSIELKASSFPLHLNECSVPYSILLYYIQTYRTNYWYTPLEATTTYLKSKMGNSLNRFLRITTPLLIKCFLCLLLVCLELQTSWSIFLILACNMLRTTDLLIDLHNISMF